jgi:hypothetical protein
LTIPQVAKTIALDGGKVNENICSTCAREKSVAFDTFS